MARCQTFYTTVFNWEFTSLPATTCDDMTEPPYVLFSTPSTPVRGGIFRVKEEDIVRPVADEADGQRPATCRMTMAVEDVDAALKRIEQAGGSIVACVFLISRSFASSSVRRSVGRRKSRATWVILACSATRRETSTSSGARSNVSKNLTLYMILVKIKSNGKFFLLFSALPFQTTISGAPDNQAAPIDRSPSSS